MIDIFEFIHALLTLVGAISVVLVALVIWTNGHWNIQWRVDDNGEMEYRLVPRPTEVEMASDHRPGFGELFDQDAFEFEGRPDLQIVRADKSPGYL